MFRFKQFTIEQDHCAMKVGTDGVLLGALAKGGQRILDIGTGTGVVALMIAQRFAEADIIGIEIDEEAAHQASANALASPFSSRVEIIHCSLQEYTANLPEGNCFNSIVSNPPFFEDSLECPDDKRSAARHTSSLPFNELLRCASHLLSPDGCFTIIIPTDRIPSIERLVSLHSLYMAKRLDIKTVERKSPKRTVLTLVKKRPDTLIHETHILTVSTPENPSGERSPWYSEITKDFYL